MDQYQRIKVLGRGSYGSAFLVKSRVGGNQLRVLKEVDLSRMPQAARGEAQNEVTVLRSLSHPNIVSYYDCFTEGHLKLCIVMEFADGGDLSDAVKKRVAEGSRFSEAEALGTFAQCCLALQHVHAKRILHRDLKCGNIFTMKVGTVKLGDFGIAKVLDATAAEAVTFIGTPVYLAPEICDNRPYNTKADIWSLGAVLYELMGLAPPFKADNLGALMMKIISADPPPLPAELYSEAARHLVSKMLRKRPELRPSADELLSEPVVAAALRRLNGNGGGGGGGECPQAQEDTVLPMRMQDPRPAADPESGREVAARGARPPLAQPGRPRLPVAPLDAASEFHRNRELAARCKARAEGDMWGGPGPAGGGGGGGGAPRSPSPEPGAAARAREGSRDARRADEERHLQALQEAAAQARRDRQRVQQRMQELEHPDPRVGGEAPHGGGYGGGGGAGGYGAGSPQLGGGAAARQAAEAQRLQELQEASAQARRERRQLEQRMRELEQGGGGGYAREAAPREDATQLWRGDPHAGAGAGHREDHEGGRKAAAEAQHLQALQEAAAEARRDRRQLLQKMQELERGEPSRDPASPSPGGQDRPHSGGGDRERLAAQKQAEEAKRLQDLQEAGAQAWRERKMLQQKMKDLERGYPSAELAEAFSPRPALDPPGADRTAAHGLQSPGPPAADRAAARAAAEQRRLQELQEAAAQARRDRKQVQHKLQELVAAPPEDCSSYSAPPEADSLDCELGAAAARGRDRDRDRGVAGGSSSSSALRSFGEVQNLRDLQAASRGQQPEEHMPSPDWRDRGSVAAQADWRHSGGARSPPGAAAAGAPGPGSAVARRPSVGQSPLRTAGDLISGAAASGGGGPRAASRSRPQTGEAVSTSASAAGLSAPCAAPAAEGAARAGASVDLGSCTLLSPQLLASLAEVAPSAAPTQDATLRVPLRPAANPARGPRPPAMPEVPSRPGTGGAPATAPSCGVAPAPSDAFADGGSPLGSAGGGGDFPTLGSLSFTATGTLPVVA